MKNKVKENNTLIVVLIVLLVCVAGFCIYLLINASNKVNSDTNGEVLNKNTKLKSDLKIKEEESKKDEDIAEKNITIESEEELVDESKLTNDERLEIKINHLYQGFSGSKFYPDNFYNMGNFNIDSIPENEKIFIALNSGVLVKVSDEIKLNSNDYIDEMKSLYGDWVTNIESLNVISASKVNKAYQYLFGTTIKNHGIEPINKERYHSNSSDKYSSKSNVYFSVYTGGGYTMGVSTHNSKYVYDENNAYVYVNVASMKPTQDGPMYYTDCINGEPDRGPYNLNGKTIDEALKENGGDFAEYKITFKKQNNDYYFYSLEKTKEGKK